MRVLGEPVRDERVEGSGGKRGKVRWEDRATRGRKEVRRKKWVKLKGMTKEQSL